MREGEHCWGRGRGEGGALLIENRISVHVYASKLADPMVGDSVSFIEEHNRRVDELQNGVTHTWHDLCKELLVSSSVVPIVVDNSLRYQR